METLLFQPVKLAEKSKNKYRKKNKNWQIYTICNLKKFDKTVFMNLVLSLSLLCKHTLNICESCSLKQYSYIYFADEVLMFVW